MKLITRFNFKNLDFKIIVRPVSTTLPVTAVQTQTVLREGAEGRTWFKTERRMFATLYYPLFILKPWICNSKTENTHDSRFY